MPLADPGTARSPVASASHGLSTATATAAVLVLALAGALTAACSSSTTDPSGASAASTPDAGTNADPNLNADPNPNTDASSPSPTDASTTCALTASTTKTSTVSASGCALLERDVSACKASRVAQGLSGFWLRFSCRVTLTKTSADGADVVQLESDGRPDYPSFYFPTTDACYEAYPSGKHNPSSIVARTFSFTVPYAPTPAAVSSQTPLGSIGMALNGVSLFDNRAKMGDDIYKEAETFDSCGAHPNNVAYHYHTEPYSLSSDDDRFIGVERDGYPVYGRRDPDGSSPVLDADGGHSGVTIDSPTADVYHYHVNEQTSLNPASIGEKQWFISKGRLHGSYAATCTGC